MAGPALPSPGPVDENIISPFALQFQPHQSGFSRCTTHTVGVMSVTGFGPSHRHHPPGADVLVQSRPPSGVVLNASTLSKSALFPPFPTQRTVHTIVLRVGPFTRSSPGKKLYA